MYRRSRRVASAPLTFFCANDVGRGKRPFRSGWRRTRRLRGQPPGSNAVVVGSPERGCGASILGVRGLYYGLGFGATTRQRRALRRVAALPALPATLADGQRWSRLHRLRAAQPFPSRCGSGLRSGGHANIGRGVHGFTLGRAHLPKVMATANVWPVIGVSQAELRSRSGARRESAGSLFGTVARPRVWSRCARGTHAEARP